MSEVETIPREFWICRVNDKPQLDCVLLEEPVGTHSNRFAHVIEKSAYDKLKKENEKLHKQIDLLNEEALCHVGKISLLERENEELREGLLKISKKGEL